MGLALITPPVGEPVTLAEAKKHLRITHTDEDEHIHGLIMAARQYAEEYTHRVLMPQTWDWTLDKFPKEFDVPLPPMIDSPLIQSISYVDIDGVTQVLDNPNLLVNGDFATDTGWTKGDGWSISGGSASCDGTQASTSNLLYSGGLTYTAGLSYIITYEVANLTAGTVRVFIGPTSGVIRSANGVYTETIAYVSGSSFLFTASADFVGDIDNVIIREYPNPKYDIDVTSVRGRIVPAYGLSWPDTRSQNNAVTVRLRAGYTIVPQPIKMAMLMLIGHLYENRETTISGTIISNTPLATDTLLNPYRVISL